jgi:hypothetical protein
MDKDLDRSKGTAFACYWKKVDADKVVTQSEALSKETGMVGLFTFSNFITERQCKNHNSICTD